jgi:hypothetical protein
MKKHPTKFLGYYITEDGIIFREPTRRYEKDLIEVGQHLRGGSEKVDLGRCYPSINISIRDESGKFIKQIRYYVHRLVAETFIPNPYGLLEVDHINRDKTDNQVSNLRWVTRKDNMKNIK